MSNSRQRGRRRDGILPPWTSSSATGPSAAVTSASTGRSTRRSPPPGSTAARAVRRSPRAGRTSASTRPPRRPRRRASGPASVAPRVPSPGSPEWNIRGDMIGRAMRLIGDGVVEREGVPGLARRLGYSERQVHRRLRRGGRARARSPLARAQRAHAARVLLETDGPPVTEIAFAAGFDSVRQFNATIREVFAATPTGLRARPDARPRAHRPARSRSGWPPGGRSTPRPLLAFLAAAGRARASRSGPATALPAESSAATRWRDRRARCGRTAASLPASGSTIRGTSHRRRALPATPGPRRGPGRRRRRAGRRPAPRPARPARARAGAFPARWTPPSWRSGRSSASRSPSPGRGRSPGDSRSGSASRCGRHSAA